MKKKEFLNGLNPMSVKIIMTAENECIDEIKKK